MKKTIGDLTRPQFQTTNRLIATLKRYAPDREVEFICLDTQRTAVEASGSPTRSLPSGTHFGDIADFVWREYLEPFIATSEPDDHITIVTNHKVVFELAGRVPSDKQPRVHISSWSRVYQSLASDARMEIDRSTRSTPVLEELMPEADLIRVVTDAMTAAHAIEPARAMRQTDLRQFLAACDDRFKKQNPKASTPGLIAEVVRFAARRGVIEVNAGIDPTNPLLWLNTRSAGSQPKVQSTVPAASHEETKTPVSVSRSKRFIEILEKRGLGFSKVRQQLYANFEELVRRSREGAPMSLSQLIMQAIGRTKSDAERTNLVRANYPWRYVRGFLIKLLSNRAVLMNDKQQAITASFANLNSKVTDLTPDWQLELEGELIIALVEGGTELYLHDLNPIAGALYLERSEQAENRVGEVIGFLLAKGRLTEDEQHALRLAKPATIIPMNREASA